MTKIALLCPGCFQESSVPLRGSKGEMQTGEFHCDHCNREFAIQFRAARELSVKSTAEEIQITGDINTKTRENFDYGDQRLSNLFQAYPDAVMLDQDGCEVLLGDTVKKTDRVAVYVEHPATDAVLCAIADLYLGAKNGN